MLKISESTARSLELGVGFEVANDVIGKALVYCGDALELFVIPGVLLLVGADEVLSKGCHWGVDEVVESAHECLEAFVFVAHFESFP